MKKKDKYELISLAIKDYSERFNENYQRVNLSQKQLMTLLRQNKHSTMCEWDYCCYGLYRNCWQDLYADGVWDLSQEQVDKIIASIIKDSAKACRRDSRIAMCKDENSIGVVIVLRDLPEHRCDYLITFTNEEGII